MAWLGSAPEPGTIGRATYYIPAFDLERYCPRGLIVAGTPVGRLTKGGLFGSFDPEAADGREVLAGFVFEDAPIYGREQLMGQVVERGPILRQQLPFPVDASAFERSACWLV